MQQHSNKIRNDPRPEQVARMREQEGKTFREIGAEMGLSHQRVWQLYRYYVARRREYQERRARA